MRSNATGRVGFDFCKPNFSCSIVGGRSPHGFSTSPRGGERHRHTTHRRARRLPCRAPGSSLSLGSLRIRRQTLLGSTEGRCKTTSSRGVRTWRVAPRVATSCVFLFQVPSPGDHGVASVCDQAHLRFSHVVPHGASHEDEIATEAQCECGSQLDKLGTGTRHC